MDANGLLTVYAILIAALTLMSEERRADFNIRFSWLDWVISTLPTIGILIIIYSPTILTIFPITPIGWFLGFTKETAIFTLLAITLSYFSIKFIGNKVPKCNHAKFASKMTTLLKEKKFPILAYLIDRHQASLLTALNKEHWRNSLQRKIKPPLNFSTDQQPSSKNNITALTQKLFSALSHLIPKEKKSQELLRIATKKCFKSPAFVRYLANTHALLAARFLSTDLLLSSDEMSNIFFKYLISTPDSILFRELRDNQNIDYSGEIFIDENNELLQFYLADINVAERNKIYNPIAEHIKNNINSNKNKDSYYNTSNENFSNSDQRWSCPIFCGIFFFQIMVSAAIFQRSKHHMWLMYYDTFAKEILSCTLRHETVNLESEFPTKFDYLLYEIFSNTCIWVTSAIYAKNIKDSETHPEHFAAKSVGKQFKNIFTSNKTTKIQKIYFLEALLSTTEKLDFNHRNDLSSLIYDTALARYEGGPIDNFRVDRIYNFFCEIDSKYNNSISSFRSKLFQHYKKMHGLDQLTDPRN